MIIRNSIRSIFRSIGKSALFTLLIFALTLALSLSVSVWVSVAQFLNDCDEYYTTISVVEYRGTEYPGDTNYDPAMAKSLSSFDSSIISKDDATLMWETPSRSFGYVDGFWRSDSFMPENMLSVFVVGSATFSEEDDFYTAVVYQTVYSNIVKDNRIIYIDKDFGTFQSDHFYLVLGEIYRGRSPILHLRASSYENEIAKSDGVKMTRMIDITADDDDEFYTIPEDNVLVKVADSLEVINNSVLVSGTNNLMALLPFHQQELYFVEGRAFTEQEYQNGDKVAVISEIMAKRLEIGVGDELNLSVALSDLPGVYNSYWVEEGFVYQNNFTVVGITNTVLDKSWYVFVPKSVGLPASQFPIGYTVGYALLDNEKASDFYIRTEPLMTNRLQLQIYDQGYSSVAIPYQTILSTAKIVTVVCFIVELAVTILFGFLYIYRQRETSETMLKLGAGKPRVTAYFLFSAGFIALVATAAGAASGYYLHDRIISWVIQTADNFTLIDSRFSNGNLTISKTLEFVPNLNWQLFSVVGILVFLLAIIACLAFILNTFQNSKQSKSQSSGPKREHRTSRLPGGSGKFASLSIWRGGARSMVVPLLAASIVIFLGNLAASSVRYSNQLEAIYDNTTIEGYYTDINGKLIGNLVINALDVKNLYSSGYPDTLSISMNEPYYFLGISRLSNGTEIPLSPLYVPRNSFVRESVEDTIRRGPDLTTTNNIRTSPEFYFADSILMTFLEPYDESILADPIESETVPRCLIPSSLMSEHNIELGDTIRIAYLRIERNPEDDQRIYAQVDLLVVGTFEKQGSEDTIYAPLSLLFESDLIWNSEQYAADKTADDLTVEDALDDEHKEHLLNTSFQSTSFTLSNSRTLPQFKDYLAEYGYSQVKNVDRVREFIVLKDASFNNAVASLKQQIRYINILNPFLYVLIGIISITASYLLVVHRKNEFAIQRGLGSTRVRTFFSFFIEQVVLCLLGLAVGFTIWHFVWGDLTDLHLMLTVGFAGCYFLGSAISIMIMNHSNVLTILLDRD